MQQLKLGLLTAEEPPRNSKAIKSQRAEYDRQNEIAARVILTDPAKYGGESAALVEWARLLLANRGKSFRQVLGERCA
jgi:hypothetical protein